MSHAEYQGSPGLFPAQTYSQAGVEGLWLNVKHGPPCWNMGILSLTPV